MVGIDGWYWSDSDSVVVATVVVDVATVVDVAAVVVAVVYLFVF